MTSFEKAEIRRLPKKYRPMNLFGYVWRTLLYIIPVLGLVFLIRGACNSKNISRRSYARSFLLSWPFLPEPSVSHQYSLSIISMPYSLHSF